MRTERQQGKQQNQDSKDVREARPLLAALYIKVEVKLGSSCCLKDFSFSDSFDRQFPLGNFRIPLICNAWIGFVLSSLTSSEAFGYDTIPRPCFDDAFRFCSRCENTTRFDISQNLLLIRGDEESFSLWLSPGPSDPSAATADPSWITFPQLWDKPGNIDFLSALSCLGRKYFEVAGRKYFEVAVSFCRTESRIIS